MTDLRRVETGTRNGSNSQVGDGGLPPARQIVPFPTQSSPIAADRLAADASAQGPPTGAPPVSNPDGVGQVDHTDGADASGVAALEDVVHESLKGLDVWFGRETAVLERDALRAAQAMAERGLPRHDLQGEGPLEVEQDLRQRAVQIYWDWVRRVRRRVEAALAKEIRAANAALTDGSAALAAYRGIQAELAAINPREAVAAPRKMPASVASDADETPQPPAWALTDTRLVQRHLGFWFWPLILVLLVIEFLANAPVFTELFPQDAEMDAGIRNWLDPSAEMTWFTGIAHLAVRLASYPDAALLALGVMMFLLFLAHIVGGSLRTWIAVTGEHPEVPPGLARGLKRQALWAGIGCTIGVVITLGVLFSARDKVYPMAEARYEEALVKRDAAKRALDEARADPERFDVPGLRTAYVEAQSEFEHRSRRRDFAQSIDQMNLAILGLNTVLAIAAAFAGFERKVITVTSEEKLGYLAASSTRAQNGRVVDTEETGQPGRMSNARLGELRALLVARRAEVTDALRTAGRAVSRARQLAMSDPMREWKAVASRLQCAIPMFRNENARLRHLDPRDIRAFDTPGLTVFEQPAFTCPPDAFAQLESCGERLEALTEDCERLFTVVRSDPSPAHSLLRTAEAV